MHLFAPNESTAPVIPAYLRDFQAEDAGTLRSTYDSGDYALLGVWATGLGKTALAAALPAVFPELAAHGMLFLVDRDVLATQSADALRSINPHLVVGIEAGKRFAPANADIVVASYQTLAASGGRRMTRLMQTREYGIVVADEAHNLSPKSIFDRVLSRLGLGSKRLVPPILRGGLTRLFVGLTATPNRHDGHGLGHFFQQVAFERGALWGIENRYLTPIRHLVVSTGQDVSGVKVQIGDYAARPLARKIDVKSRNDLIVRSYVEEANGKPFIAFAVNIEHAKHLAAAFCEAGIPAQAVYHAMDKDGIDRDAALRDFDTGALRGLVSVEVLTKGFDGKVGCVILARLTKSHTLYIQMVGRGLRPQPTSIGALETLEEREAAVEASDKPYCLLLDFVDHGHEREQVADLFGTKDHASRPKRVRQAKRDAVEVVHLVSQEERLRRAEDERRQKARELAEKNRGKESLVYELREVVPSVARSTSKFRAVSDNLWMLAGKVASLSVPKGAHGPARVVRIVPQADGRYAVESRVRAHSTPDGFVPETRIVSDHRFASAEDAIRAYDKTLAERVPDVLPLVRRNQWWHKRKPSDAQLAALRGAGVDTERVKSKGAAASLLAAMDVERAARKAEKEG